MESYFSTTTAFICFPWVRCAEAITHDLAAYGRRRQQAFDNNLTGRPDYSKSGPVWQSAS